MLQFTPHQHLQIDSNSSSLSVFLARLQLQFFSFQKISHNLTYSRDTFLSVFPYLPRLQTQPDKNYRVQ